jgi:hypothetical protein
MIMTIILDMMMIIMMMIRVRNDRRGERHNYCHMMYHTKLNCLYCYGDIEMMMLRESEKEMIIMKMIINNDDNDENDENDESG